MCEGQPEIPEENIENSDEEIENPDEDLPEEDIENSDDENSDEDTENSDEDPSEEDIEFEDAFDVSKLFQLDIERLKIILNIDPDAISDESLESYETLVRFRVLAKMSSIIDLEDIETLPDYALQLIEETIVAGIACHIAMVDPTILYTPTDYKVGDVEEGFSDKFYDKVPSWCEYYNGLLDDLLNEIRPKGHLLTYKRRGLSYHRGWSHRI